MSNRCTTPTEKAFTLVELLVVIAIISLLASMLLPAIEQAMDEAKLTSCMNNQKQCVLATMQYTDENKGRYPDWNAHCGWSPMESLGDPYYKSCQLGRVRTTGYLTAEPLIDPGFVNRNASYRCVVTPTKVRWDWLAINPTSIYKWKNDSNYPGTYAMYLWHGAYSKIRRADKPLKYTDAVTMCSLTNPNQNLVMSHNRIGANILYDDGHARRMDEATIQKGYATIISKAGDGNIPYSTAAGGYWYTWWNFARDLEK